MRGFRTRTPLEEATAWVDGLPALRRAERVDLVLAAGRALAEDLVSEVDVPSFPRAAMDGWALRGAETFGADAVEPVRLSVRGRALPGADAGPPLGPGEAVRIMTGAALPAGADAVLPAEQGEEREGRLLVRAPVPPARHVGAVGEDVRRGSRLLAAGRILRPQDLGVAASVGRGRLAVLVRPRVTILATGDELLAPGERPRGARIVDSNTPMLAALVARDGGRVVATQRLPDQSESLERALAAAVGDVVLVGGGSSVGEEDHAPGILAALGELAFHGVALRPASPTGAGRLGERAVFLLPGNPVSCLSAYDLLAGRLVRRMAGRPVEPPYPVVRVPLARKVSSGLGMVDYVRVRLVDGRAEPVMSRGASILTSTTEADGYLLVPRDSEGFDAGTEVEVRRYDALETSAGP